MVDVWNTPTGVLYLEYVPILWLSIPFDICLLSSPGIYLCHYRTLMHWVLMWYVNITLWIVWVGSSSWSWLTYDSVFRCVIAFSYLLRVYFAYLCVCLWVHIRNDFWRELVLTVVCALLLYLIIFGMAWGSECICPRAMTGVRCILVSCFTFLPFSSVFIALFIMSLILSRFHPPGPIPLLFPSKL